MRLILARHGQTDWNKERRILGRSDLELNETGRKQAGALAEALKNVGVRAIYTSPLKRTLETASVIGRQHKVDVIALKGLREIDAGEVDGLTYQEMMVSHSDFLEKWIRDCTSVTPPGGCSLQEVQDGAWSAVQDILAQERESAARGLEDEDRTVVAVTHFFPILSIVVRAIGLPLSECRRIKLDLASISVLDFTPTNVVLASLNDTCHLKEGGR
jgi:probable phosphoglycerate mutase